MVNVGRGRAAVYVLLAAVLAFALWVRLDAFWMPHWIGDQTHYAALAMKLDHAGLEGYNLRGVRIRTSGGSPDSPLFLSFDPAPPGDEGDLVRGLRQMGHDYLDEPLHYRAPLFPFCLMLSHRFFSTEDVHSVCYPNFGAPASGNRPATVFRAQFWAAVVPVAFNLGVILLTFFLGRRLFGDRAGLVAAFLMASNSLSVMLAYRLLVEDSMTFFMLASFLFYVAAARKKSPVLALAGGAAAGLAILAKQTAVLLLPVVFAHAAFFPRPYGRRRLFVATAYAAAAALVSGPWFFEVWRVFGTPFHQPGSASVLASDKTGWFQTLAQRPAPAIFFSLGPVLLCPFFSLAIFTFARFFRQSSGRLRHAAEFPAESLLWLWVLAFFLFIAEPWKFPPSPFVDEHRFLYMAYPALAILAASAWDRGRGWWAGRGRSLAVYDLAGVAMLLLNAWYGIPFVRKIIFNDDMLY